MIPLHGEDALAKEARKKKRREETRKETLKHEIIPNYWHERKKNKPPNADRGKLIFSDSIRNRKTKFLYDLTCQLCLTIFDWKT